MHFFWAVESIRETSSSVTVKPSGKANVISVIQPFKSEYKKIFIQPFFSFSVRAKKRRKKSDFVGPALEKTYVKPSNFSTNGKRFSTAVEFAEKMKKQ